jgi:hypothetical protein
MAETRGYWCSTATGTASTAIWSTWCDTGTSASTTTTCGPIWVRWNGTAAATASYYEVSAPKQPTAEEVEARRLAREEAVRARAEEDRKQREADKRAEELLVKNLDKEQRKQFEKEGKFKVVLHDGKFFEIYKGWSGNVRELSKDGKPIARLCIHPQERVPLADLMLAQKLMLETNRELFEKTANRTLISS